MTQRQKYLLSKAYDAATALADAYEVYLSTQSEAKLRLVDERVRSFLDCREECQEEGVPAENIDSLLTLLPGKLHESLS